MWRPIASLLLAIGSVFPTLAAEKSLEATISDGRVVILLPDGTWRFKNEQPKEGAAASSHSKPVSATSVLKSRRGFFELWYDPQKWKAPGGIDNASAEFSLRHSSGDAFGLLVIERIEIKVAALRDLALENAKNIATEVTVVQEDERIVNGQKVLAVVVDVTTKGVPFRFLYYFWTGPQGATQLLAWTPRNLFEEYRQDLTDLLDGMIIKSGA